MRVLFRLAMLAVAIVLAVFAVSNRGTVALGLWPLPDIVELPLYLIILACLLVGFLAGELAAWMAGRHWRREVRRSARRIASLERELAAIRAEREPVAVPTPTRLAG
jgi:uncharacterized integral membrane protein